MNDASTMTADDVLEFIDTFAGQENTGDEVRDFVQLAARFIAENKPVSEWHKEPVLEMFVEWCAERERAEAITYDRDGPH